VKYKKNISGPSDVNQMAGCSFSFGAGLFVSLSQHTSSVASWLCVHLYLPQLLWIG